MNAVITALRCSDARRNNKHYHFIAICGIIQVQRETINYKIKLIAYGILPCYCLCEKGTIMSCHLHNQQKINKETDEYKTLFGQLRKINNDLAEKRIQLEPQDILQVAFPNISDRFRGFGYILDNVFYLIYLDPYHKVYK